MSTENSNNPKNPKNPAHPEKSAKSQLVILYLHGFLSSPASIKAQQTRHYCDAHRIEIYVPELPFEPETAIQQVSDLATRLASDCTINGKQLLLIGSSLGGYYATYLAEKLAIPAALINPAVQPHGLFKEYLGEHQHFYNGQTYLLTEQHVSQIERLYQPNIAHPKQLLLLLQTGDETLDYRRAARYYQDCQQICQGGGDHSYQGYADRLDSIVCWRLALAQ